VAPAPAAAHTPAPSSASAPASAAPPAASASASASASAVAAPAAAAASNVGGGGGGGTASGSRVARDADVTEPKVGELDVAVRRDEQVVGLHVPVDDPPRCSGTSCILKLQTLKPGYHFIGSRVGSPGGLKIWVSWIQPVQAPPRVAIFQRQHDLRHVLPRVILPEPPQLLQQRV
jgi:hypothetical protein